MVERHLTVDRREAIMKVAPSEPKTRSNFQSIVKNETRAAPERLVEVQEKQFNYAR